MSLKPQTAIVAWIAFLGLAVLLAGAILPPVLSGLSTGGLQPITQERAELARSRLLLTGAGLILAAMLLDRFPTVLRLASRETPRNLVLLLSSALVAVTGAEIALRVVPAYGPDEIRQRSPIYVPARFAVHRFTPRDHDLLEPRDDERPALRTRLRNGYRGAGFAPSKPAGEVRIAVLGGSQVYDLNAGPEEDWPTATGRLLKQRGLTGVRVINAGIPGHNLLDAAGRLLSEIHLFEPDYVAVCNCHNDLRYFGWVAPERPPLRVLPTLTEPTDARRLPEILTRSQIAVRLHAALVPLRHASYSDERSLLARRFDHPTPWAVRQYALGLHAVAAIARGGGAVPVFISQPRAVTPENAARVEALGLGNDTTFDAATAAEAFALCDGEMRRVAREQGAVFLDLARFHSGRLEHFTDVVHLNPAGSRALAETAAELFYALLTGRSAAGLEPPPSR
ncbi:MAG: SGNH/GDSL hydrolase family protein [Acidobacteria bacterium]|nr:MAG: SGNH/GDSL hydrolase family protein [Acidobacteriota bacterium]